MNLPIPALRTVFNSDTEETYYVNEEMIKNGVLIKYVTLDNEDIPLGKHGCIETIVEVICMDYKKPYAARFILLWEPLIPNIQLYRVVKDLYDLYLDNSKDSFINVMKMLSSQYVDSEISKNVIMNTDIIKETETELHYVEYGLKAEGEK